MELLPTKTATHKRRSSEYRDPDYPSNVAAAASTELVLTGHKHTKLQHNDNIVTKNANGINAANDQRYKILCNIISREFQNELALKKEQLSEIDIRLGHAYKLMDRLRYSVISDYYRKQEVPITKPVADLIRGNQTLFKDEHDGPQLPLHPSVKRLIGKRPQSHVLDNIMGIKPERSAAVQAKITIRERNPAKKRHERRLQRLIRKRGIVIDHTNDVSNVERIHVKSESIDNGIVIDDNNFPSTSKYAQLKAERLNTEPTKIVGHQLNSTRVNNKSKHFFIVGNTSKYIGAEQDQAANSNALSHKWLVYIHGKDLQKPIETYIKKVRFYLHHSYRPNDVVDVCSPPFQIVRRGWGEFPIRIQLFFHDHLQQKPVQLIHNLILDKSLSGLHTLGAETLVEIWLRTEKMIIENEQNLISNVPETTTLNGMYLSAASNSNLVDDKLLGVVNSVELQSSVNNNTQTVPLPCKLSSPLKEVSAQVKQKPIVSLVKETSTIANSSSNSLYSKPTTIPNTKQHDQSATNNNNQESSDILNTEHAITNGGTVNCLANKNKLMLFNGTQVKEKVVPSTDTKSLLISSEKQKGKLMTAELQNVIIKPKANKKTAKNIVFQKEGKLYIIDPLQVKIKQEQKKQQSLLKCNQQQQTQQTQQQPQQQEHSLAVILYSIANDHDYGFTPVSLMPKKPMTPEPPEPIVLTLDTESSTVPPIHLGMRQTRLNIDSHIIRMQNLRLKFEQNFHSNHFNTMRTAVEFLLRRLPMYAERNTVAAAFPFVHESLAAFEKLSAIKQRSCEWLRAKTIVRFMSNHPDLQNLAATDKESYWSIREVIIFSRVYCFTPILKSIVEIPNKANEKQCAVAALVKSELEQEHQHIPHVTLTSNAPIAAWINKHIQNLADYEYEQLNNHIINVVDVDESDEMSNSVRGYKRKDLTPKLFNNNANLFYMPPLPHLTSARELVTDAYKDLGLQLATEELIPNVLHQSALTMLSQCLNIFVGKLLRQVIATKIQHVRADKNVPLITHQNMNITPHDIGRVIAQYVEFDFLTNSYLGVSTESDNSDKSDFHAK